MKTFTLLFILYQSISMAQQYETQSFDLIKKVDEAEIRFYPPAVKIRSSRKNGFGALFGYISGRNSRDQKIAMTTPVYLGKNEDNEMMEFVLPRSIDPPALRRILFSSRSLSRSRANFAAHFGINSRIHILQLIYCIGLLQFCIFKS